MDEDDVHDYVTDFVRENLVYQLKSLKKALWTYAFGTGWCVFFLAWNMHYFWVYLQQGSSGSATFDFFMSLFMLLAVIYNGVQWTKTKDKIIEAKAALAALN